MTKSLPVQVPNVTCKREIFERMASDRELRAFASRMNEICDDMGIPPKGQGRQTAIRDRFKVSQRAALKWLEGETYPSIDHARDIARWANVRFEWLMTGDGEKRASGSSGDSCIQHVVTVMQAMEPEKRYLVSKLVDTILDPGKGPK